MNKKFIVVLLMLLITVLFGACENKLNNIYELSSNETNTTEIETTDQEYVRYEDNHTQKKEYIIEWIQKIIFVPLEKTVDVKIPQIIVESPNEQIINDTISEIFLSYCTLDYPEVSVETKIHEYNNILSIYINAVASPGRIPIVKCINYDLKNDTILTIEHFLKIKGYSIQEVKEEIWNSSKIFAHEGLFVNQFYINDNDEIIIVSDMIIHETDSIPYICCFEYNLTNKNSYAMSHEENEFWENRWYMIYSENRIYPVYKNKYPYSNNEAEFKITDEVMNIILHNTKKFTDLLETENSSIQYSSEFSDKISIEYNNMEIHVDMNSINISVNQIGINNLIDVQDMRVLIHSNIIINAACAYLDITTPDIFKKVEFDSNGSIISVSFDIIEESRLIKEGMSETQRKTLYKTELYNRFFNKVKITYYPESNKTIINIYKIDTSEINGEYEIIPYYQALEKLSNNEYYTTSLIKEVDIATIFNVCEIAYSNDFINDYYIPCYRFTVYDKYRNPITYDVAAVDYTNLK